MKKPAKISLCLFLVLTLIIGLCACGDDCEKTTKRETFAKVGNYVTYGTYPQTKSGNDAMPIEWLVLDYDEKNNRALLISRYGLDCQKFHTSNTSYTSVTWETCTLRKWLNNDFIKKAFTTEERKAILTTCLDNSKSQCFDWSATLSLAAVAVGGNDTQDQIFLLSYAEANKYFNVIFTYNDGNNAKSRVAPTAYAIAQGAYVYSGNQTVDGLASGYWWLRSPSYYQSGAAEVGPDGSLGESAAHFGGHIIRPAFWMDLSGI